MQGQTHFRGFLFDLDNTLLDFEASEEQALLAAVNAPADRLVPEYRRINALLWKEAEAGRISLDALATERFRRLAAALDLAFDSDSVSRRYLAELASRAHPIPGALGVLDSLSRGAVLGLLTNGIASVQRSRIEIAGLSVFFHGVFISEEIGLRKPDPAIFHHAARELHLAPHELLCVGDNPAADIRGGQAAGMTTCWFNRRGVAYPEGEPRPDHVISALEELLDLAPQLS